MLSIGIGASLVLTLYLPGDGLWTGDQGAKLIQVQSLLQNRFSDPALSYPGAAIDTAGDFSPLPALYTVPGQGGAVSVYSYPYALVCALLFATFGNPGLVLPSLAATAGLLALFVPLARSMGIGSPRWFAVILAVATPVLFYAVSFWEHQMVACIAAGSLVLAVRALDGGRAAWPFSAGVVAGLGFLIRPEAFHLGPALCLGLAAALPGGARRLELAGTAVLGWILGLLPGVWLHLAVYGHPLGGAATLNFGESTLQSVPLLAEKLLAARGQLVLHLAFDRAPALWLFALSVALALAIRLTAGRRRAAVCLALTAAALGSCLPASGHFLKTGLLASCPLLLLALAPPGAPSPGKEARSLLLWFCAIYFLAVAATAPNDGGAQWGPRYLLPLIPPAAALAWVQAERLLGLPRRLERAAAVLLVAVLVMLSAALQLHSLTVLEHSLSRSRNLQEATASVGHQVVLTDVWWAPQILARLYFERQVFLLHPTRRLKAFVATLAAHEIPSFVFVATRDEFRNLERLRAAGAACRSTAELAGPLLVLDCRLTPAL